MGGAAWLITGSVYRWRNEGQICTGNNVIPPTTLVNLKGNDVGTVNFVDIPGAALIKSGNFMQDWLIFIYVMLGFFCLTSCCVAALAKKRIE